VRLASYLLSCPQRGPAQRLSEQRIPPGAEKVGSTKTWKIPFVGIRLDPELKEALEEIAGTEERSVSQICELLLRRGIDAYKSEGSKYLRSLGRHRKKETGSE
jgi:hypothetical protein